MAGLAVVGGALVGLGALNPSTPATPAPTVDSDQVLDPLPTFDSGLGEDGAGQGEGTWDEMSEDYGIDPGRDIGEEGGETTGTTTLDQEVAAGNAERYSLFVHDDPAVGVEVFRTLVPAGWTPKGNVDWSILSVVAPAVYEFHAISDDALASVSILSDMHYGYMTMDGVPMGDSTDLGLPIVPPMTNAEYAEKLAAGLTGVENLTLTGTQDADPDKTLEKQFLAGQAPTVEAMSATNTIDRQIFEASVTAGTATKNGTDLEVAIVLVRYQLDTHTQGTFSRFDYSNWQVPTTFVIVAPAGQAGAKAVNDISSMLDSFTVNSHWYTARAWVADQVTRQLLELKQPWDTVRGNASSLTAGASGQVAGTSSDWSGSSGSVEPWSGSDSQERIMQGWTDTVTGNERYSTPDGGTIAVENKWDHVWMSEGGDVYGTNSALDDPGSGWSELDTYSMSSDG